MTEQTLMSLSVNHDYYCSDNNFYSSKVSGKFESMTEFLDSFECMDVDLNLCFRWDVHKNDDGTYSAEVFLILQRKGIFKPCFITSFKDHEVDRFVSYLQKHKSKIYSLWQPLTPPGGCDE
jgi:hypothetical protein